MKRNHVIEAIVVVIVLILLSVVSVPRFLDAQKTAGISEAKRRAAKIANAMIVHKEELGFWSFQMNVMTDPGIYDELIERGYLSKEDDLTDPFLGPGEFTNDGQPSIMFWTEMNRTGKFQHYLSQTNQYRGPLPGNYLYTVGSCGPDQTINMDQQPMHYRSGSPRVNMYETFIDYDSSNGIMSSGDIHHLIKGKITKEQIDLANAYMKRIQNTSIQEER